MPPKGIGAGKGFSPDEYAVKKGIPYPSSKPWLALVAHPHSCQIHQPKLEESAFFVEDPCHCHAYALVKSSI